MRTHFQPQRALSFLVLFVGVGSAGCGTFNRNVGHLFGGDDTKSVAAPSVGADGPTIAIEFYPEDGKPERAYLPLDSVTYVQQVFERTNAHRRFSRMKAQIHRQLPDGGSHKLDVRYDRKSRRVEPGFDYALHPGDRLQITEDTTNVIDDMLESVAGPFSSKLPF
ncbi:MAG: hypothetical protein ACC628_14985 [Pirellulaceae bacterium]